MRNVVEWTESHSTEWRFDGFSAVKWSVGEYESDCMQHMEWSGVDRYGGSEDSEMRLKGVMLYCGPSSKL